MEPPAKFKVMFHEVSWFTFTTSIVSLIALYYFYVGITFYRQDFQALYCRLMGQAELKNNGIEDLGLPDHSIMGEALLEDTTFVGGEELLFGPSEIPDETEELVTENSTELVEANSILSLTFSEMIAEIKTLIRVINESGETKENFEMLFKLLTQKYGALKGTVYERQVNEILLDEGAPQFPFSLNLDELISYWKNEN